MGSNVFFGTYQTCVRAEVRGLSNYHDLVCIFSCQQSPHPCLPSHKPTCLCTELPLPPRHNLVG